MIISTIVAVAENGVIGKANSTPWYLPAELAYFKQKTTGHPIIMGRKTHESIGRALPDRTNIIITSNPNYSAEGCVVVNSLPAALEEAKKAPGAEEIFVIGGESIYQEALPFIDRIYLTRVGVQVDGDRFFKFDAKAWRQTSSQKHKADERNKYDYEFAVLERS
jgi:dihydrofolate reductase